jgi:WD40 repeat protein
MAVIWDVKTGRPLHHLVGHKGKVYAATFKPNGQELITASADGNARMWSTQTGSTDFVLGQMGQVVSADYSSDGELVVTAGADEIGHIWDAQTGESLIDLYGSSYPVTKAAFLDQGTGSRQVGIIDGGATARIYTCEACGSVTNLLDVASRFGTYGVQ